MKNVKSIFGALTLGLVLSSAIYAGDVSTPGLTTPPPPPQSAATNAPGTANSPGIAVQILIAALSAFYQ